MLCPLTVGGSFEAKTRSLSGQLAVDPAQPSRLIGEMPSICDARFAASACATRTCARTTSRSARASSTRVPCCRRSSLKGEAATVTGATTFTATLLVHGTRKPVSGQVRIARTGADVQVDASFPVNLPDFGIPEPRYLGVGVKDQVQVKVKFGSAR